MTAAPQHIPLGEKIAYGAGDTATNLVWRTLMVFLGFFYTDVFGLTPAAVGTLLLVSRFSDGISDLVMGMVADRTRSRWGKFRPWILWTAVPFGVLTVLTFTTPELGPTGKLVYAYVTYNLLILVFTANNIPYSALTGVMSADPQERTRLSSFRFVGAFLGALLTQGLNEYLVQFFGQGDATAGYRWTMVSFSIVAVFLLLATFAFTRERVPSPPREKLNPADDFSDLLRNRPWLILFLVGLSFVTLTTLKQGSTMYYFVYYMDARGLAAAYMVTGTLGALLGASLTGSLTRRWSRRRIMQLCLILAGLSSLALYAARGTDTTLIFILGFITEAATGPIVTLFFAMLADSADFSEWQHGRRATGLIYSAGTVSIKFGSGLGGAMVGWTLATHGYVANTTQSPEALTGIRLLMSILPAAAALFGFLAFLFYPLDERTLQTIQRDLESRRNAPPSPTPEPAS